MSQDLTLIPEIEMFVGERRPIGIVIRDRTGAVVNLTGSTVFFMAKSALTDADADAILDEDVTTFEDPTTGRASIPIDLTGLPSALQAGGATLYADIVVQDSGGDITNYGMFAILLKKGVRDSVA